MAQPLDEYEQKLVDNIEEHGWQCTSVFDPDGVQPWFSYSIGFPVTLGCPDFIVFGLTQEVMHAMLWEVFRQIKDGKVPTDNMRWMGLLGGDYECVSRNVHPSNFELGHFNSALWYLNYKNHPQGALNFMQLVWPGTGKVLFPWEEGCPQDVIDAQKPLYLPDQTY